MLRNDESILIHIRGRDCVAIEARYHKKCYQKYTKCLSKKPSQDLGPTLYDEAFDNFCSQIIEKRIINNKEILLLGYLLKKFISCVKDIEDTTVPFQAARLKRRIEQRYPQIVFHFSKTMNKGTLVYSDNVVPGDVADDVMDLNCDTEEESDDEHTEEETEETHSSCEMHRCSSQQLFHAGMEIRKLLNESKGIDSGWPPDSHDLTIELATASIPPKLFNFVALILGYSNEPAMDVRVQLEDSERCKVVSICQDLVYGESKGRKQTHKSLALGMAVRELTGSVKVVEILHGLGHSVSSATVYKHDSALAVASSRGQDIIIPRNINAGLFATIVWDNNDFNEETPSGKGTTHVANGIMIQNGVTTLEAKVEVSRKLRTVEAPETNIHPYTCTRKGVPSLSIHGAKFPLEEQKYRPAQNDGKNSDLGYVLSKIHASEMEKSLPSWTGFNTQLAADVPNMSTIGYLPVIDAPVTDLATVNAILRHSVSICQRLQLPEIVIVFDEAIYAKAQQIRWKEQEYMDRLVVRLGDFHTVMSYCSGIAKIYKDAGLQV